jgi:hypothetical protein
VLPSQRSTWRSSGAEQGVEPQRQSCELAQQMVPSQTLTAVGSKASARKQEQPSFVGEHETARHVQAVPGLGQVEGAQHWLFGTSAGEHWKRFAGNWAEGGWHAQAAP